MAEQQPGVADHGTATAQGGGLGTAHNAPGHGAAHGTAGSGVSTHSHGTMNTYAQQKTFASFLRMVMRAAVIIVGVLIFMALANA